MFEEYSQLDVFTKNQPTRYFVQLNDQEENVW